jgi:hypothetical protein
MGKQDDSIIQEREDAICECLELIRLAAHNVHVGNKMGVLLVDGTQGDWSMFWHVIDPKMMVTKENWRKGVDKDME